MLRKNTITGFEFLDIWWAGKVPPWWGTFNQQGAHRGQLTGAADKEGLLLRRGVQQPRGEAAGATGLDRLRADLRGY